MHGYSDEFLSDKKNLEIADEFQLYRRKDYYSHAEFDLGHLNNELSLINKNISKENIIDTLEIARNNFQDQVLA